jgi:DNA polymerase-3 subunit delta
MSKLLKEKCLSVEFKRLEEPELLRWTRNKLAEDGAAADESTVRHLVHLAGPDLRRLKIEIEKLVTASMPEKIITLLMVDDLVPYTRELDNWLLTEEMIAGRKANAIKLARKLMDDGAEPLAILGLIGSNFRRLLTAKELMTRGVNRNEVSRVSKAPYKSQEQFFAFARRTPSRSFADALGRISAADVAIKNSIGGSGPAGARVQLEMLICELALL